MAGDPPAQAAQATAAPRRLDRWERGLIPVSILGGAVFAVGTMHVVVSHDTTAMLAGMAVAAAGLSLWGPFAVLPALRRRPWAVTAASVPAGVALLATFGLAGLTGWGPGAGRPGYAWGSLAAALGLALFGVYAHREGMRRFSPAA